jgi:hypothetical protein
MKESKLSGNTIILLMLTPYVYFVTYLTEMGYCTYFGIPPALISLSPGNISSIAAILGIIYAGIHIINFLEDKLFFILAKIAGKRIPGMEYLAKSNILTGLVVLIIVLSLIDISDTSTRNLFLTISLILLIITILLSLRKKTSDKPDNEQEMTGNAALPKQDSLIGRLLDSKVTGLIIMTALVTFPATEKGGEYIGRKQESFMKVNGDKTMLGVVIYGDKIIGKEFRNDTLGTKTFIIPFNNTTTIEMIKMRSRPVIISNDPLLIK